MNDNHNPSLAQDRNSILLLIIYIQLYIIRTYNTYDSTRLLYGNRQISTAVPGIPGIYTCYSRSIVPGKPDSISEMAESFTKVILDAVEAEVSPPPRRTHKLGWCETVETSAAFTIAWNAMEDARRFMRLNPRGRTAWKTLRTACANLRAVIDAGLLAYFEEYLAETETIRRQRPAGFLQARRARWDWEVERRQVSSSLWTRMARY